MPCCPLIIISITYPVDTRESHGLPVAGFVWRFSKNSLNKMEMDNLCDDFVILKVSLLCLWFCLNWLLCGICEDRSQGHLWVTLSKSGHLQGMCGIMVLASWISTVRYCTCSSKFGPFATPCEINYSPKKWMEN